ncbi:MAG: AraC family transcriptional regulator [Syntrophaceae bacterium]|nr:AraC family transcriptional regulator [Syntrophaceae bacterium]
MRIAPASSTAHPQINEKIRIPPIRFHDGTRRLYDISCKSARIDKNNESSSNSLVKRNSTDTHLTVSVAVLSQLVRYLSHLKIGIEPIFRAAGLAAAVLDSPDSHISLESYIAVEDEAARVSGDAYFGLHMGEFVEPGNYSILGYMMMNSRTLGEAFEKSARYHKIIGNMITPVVRPGLKTVKIIFTTPKNAPVFSRHCFETIFSSMFVMMRNLTGREVNPVEIGFTQEAPSSTAEYARVFQCPVLFGQKCNYVVLSYSIASIPLLQPNPDLLRYFEDYAREMLAGIENQNTVTQQVTRHIIAKLDNKSISLAGIAKEMSMSVRTLQNRLKDEGTVFSELLEQTRENLAKKYLQKNYTVEEITFLLGFAESSVFRKAFKKWTGATPGEYRQMALARK